MLLSKRNGDDYMNIYIGIGKSTEKIIKEAKKGGRKSILIETSEREISSLKKTKIQYKGLQNYLNSKYNI